MPSAIQQTMDTTWTFLQTKTLAGLTPDERAAVLALAAPAAARRAAEDCALTGNVSQTQAACQVWQRAVKAVVLAQYAARCRAPLTPAGWPHQWVTDGTGTYCLRCEVRQADVSDSAEPPRPRKGRSHAQ